MNLVIIPMLDMVKIFRSIDATLSGIGLYFYGNKTSMIRKLQNALAWFAAEEVARSFVEVMNEPT